MEEAPGEGHYVTMTRRQPWLSSFINISHIKELFYAVTSLSARCEPAPESVSSGDMELESLLTLPGVSHGKQQKIQEFLPCGEL